MDNENVLLCAVVAVIVVAAIYLTMKPCREHYRDPIFLNRKKMMCDWYPRSNGSIYGEASHLLSGFAYYNSAY